jgi:anti-anti-sigma regulatory factor
MLRITERRGNDQTFRLRLDGTISTDSISDLEMILAIRQPSNDHKYILDMGGVGFMNEAAARKLAVMRGETLQIINCSPFIAALLDTVGRTD